MDYIKFKEDTLINKNIGEPIKDNSFLVRVINYDGTWQTVRDNDMLVFSRYLDGVMMSGYLGLFKKHKVKNKKFKGLE